MIFMILTVFLDISVVPYPSPRTHCTLHTRTLSKQSQWLSFGQYTGHCVTKIPCNMLIVLRLSSIVCLQSMYHQGNGTQYPRGPYPILRNHYGNVPHMYTISVYSMSTHILAILSLSLWIVYVLLYQRDISRVHMFAHQ